MSSSEASSELRLEMKLCVCHVRLDHELVVDSDFMPWNLTRLNAWKVPIVIYEYS